MTVTAPPGTVHEAFFDSATTTAGVGYFTGATTTGVLKPATFSVGGVSTTITGLKWEGGSVVLSLSPLVSLGDSQLSFIDLDGTLAFALGASAATADSAAGTLTWAVADRPWSGGDLLMLRIGPAPDPAPATRSIRLLSPGDTWTIYWGTVAGASSYRVQYRIGRAGSWTGLPATTGASQTFGPQDGLLCGGNTYYFRVQARGDGKTYNTGWGAPSSSLSQTTGACNQPPVFSTSTYAFSVSEDAATSTVVGTVSATDPDGDALTYSIDSGNDGGAFSIDGSSGSIAVAVPLDYETTASYTLTVEARDGKENGTATATVHISVTNVAEGAPSAPRDVNVSLSGDTFTISWSAVNGADQYRAQHRTGGAGEWTSLDATAATTQTFSPAACDTTYEFRVQARGDGETHVVAWGVPSEPVSHTTGACSQPPAFATSSYAFSVAEDAATSTVVGTVSATDPDGDVLTYSISSGNGGGAFSIDGSSGSIAVAVPLDYESVSSYTLTVEARDGSVNGTARATVHISVTNAAEETPPAPQGVSLAVADDAFTVSWNAVDGASGYRVEHRASGGEWSSVTATTTSRTISPEDGVSCGHEFRVSAHGDGETYVAAWGAPSGVVSYSSGACNRPPVFATSTYAFSVAEDTAAWSVVGFVLATDPDAGDFVTYHITAGNEGDVFQASAGNDGGHILVWGALDYESESSYTLTVEARDGKAGGTARATVVITVTDVVD